MRRHVTVHEGAGASTTRGVTARGVMETGDDIPKRADAVRSGPDVSQIGAHLSLPPLHHGAAARYHEGVVQSILIVLSVHQRAFLGKDECL